MEMKFLGLIHDVMFVSEYLSKLLKLSRFATHQVNTEAGKCQRFQEGLKPQIREKVSLLELEQFDKLVGEAKIAEREYESRNQFFNSKKRGRELEPDNIRRSGGNIRVQVNKKENSEGNEKRMTLTECQKCGLKHLGNIFFHAEGLYFNYGKKDHMSVQCPEPKTILCHNCKNRDICQKIVLTRQLN